jgi:RNA polymerase sigma-70 factor (ECF subfamily)
VTEVAAGLSQRRDASAEPRPDFDALYREHAATVARWAARIGTPGMDVDDIVQEVFLVVNRRLREFRGDAKIVTWLFRITENTVRNWRRRQHLRRLFRRAQDDALAADVPSARPTPLEEIERRQNAEAVYRILDRLPERYRTVVILFEIEEMSTEQIAELLEIKAGTVRVWLHRARAHFLRLQEKEERRRGTELERARGGSR